MEPSVAWLSAWMRNPFNKIAFSPADAGKPVTKMRHNSFIGENGTYTSDVTRSPIVQTPLFYRGFDLVRNGQFAGHNPTSPRQMALLRQPAHHRQNAHKHDELNDVGFAGSRQCLP